MPSLLISAPNKDGGIAIINEDEVTVLYDNKGHTGLSFSDSTIAIAMQDQTIHLIGNEQKLSSIRLGKRADIHDVMLKDNLLYAAITGNNKIIEINTHNRKITNTWKFEGKGDSCHINCLAEIHGRIHFSAFGKFLKHREYKTSPEGKGFVADLLSGKVIITGLSHPHSIISEEENIWLCNSLMQEVLRVSGDSRISSGDLGGYTRGLCVLKNSLFVGVSALRHAENGYRDNAFIVELDKNNLQVIRKIDVPFKEIYAVTEITSEKEKILIEKIRRVPTDKIRDGIFAQIALKASGIRYDTY